MKKEREFILEVKRLAKFYEVPVFVVTDGASAYSNNGCEAVSVARKNHVEWEESQGITPEDNKEDNKMSLMNDLRNAYAATITNKANEIVESIISEMIETVKYGYLTKKFDIETRHLEYVYRTLTEKGFNVELLKSSVFFNPIQYEDNRISVSIEPNDDPREYNSVAKVINRIKKEKNDPSVSVWNKLIVVVDMKIIDVVIENLKGTKYEMEVVKSCDFDETDPMLDTANYLVHEYGQVGFLRAVSSYR